MGLLQILTSFSLFWVVVFGILKAFEVFQMTFENLTNQIRNFPIGRFLDHNGLSLSLGYFGWYTQRFNWIFSTLNAKIPKFLHRWFSFGVFIGILSSAVATLLLLWTIISKWTAPNQEPVLTPIVKIMRYLQLLNNIFRFLESIFLPMKWYIILLLF